MPGETLIAMGLILNMFGVVVIFVWGPPQPDFQAYVGISVEDGTVLSDGKTASQHVKQVARKKRVYTLISRSGLVIIFFGFGLQLLGTICG